ncbi:hypothetical protein QE109_07760 [Fusibacter bizertensis]|uniref:Uncharacterized protein n=1 Tax=Fusibacter bizertensis TaxID=1488331 RepID=A0ABT6NC93_9FIRM|nr:hypothetical protein [Fusibacter bizertensis]MDH8678039.1 hypothetical protein [Fusibacter bizertensis]
MYDIRDILRKGIDITKKIKAEYKKLQENSGDMRMRILIGVFIRSADRDISYYEQLVENLTDSIAEAIDFGVFDKISSLVNQFARTIGPINITERKPLVEYALSQQKSLYALLVDIQGRMVTGNEETSIAYYVLTDLIEEKRRFILELEQMSQ